MQVQSVGVWVQVHLGAGASALGAGATDYKVKFELITATFKSSFQPTEEHNVCERSGTY